MLRSTDSGVTWRVLAVPKSVSVVNAADCTTARVCLVTGGLSSPAGLALVTTDSGRTWATISLKQVRWTGLASCVAPGACVLEGSDVAQNNEIVFGLNLLTRYVEVEHLPGPPMELMSGLDCTETGCITVGQGVSIARPQILTSSVGGAAWHVDSVPTVAGLSLQGAGCATALRCWAVGDNSTGAGVSLSTSDGGTTWHVDHVPNSIFEIDYMTCPVVTMCVGEGANAAVNNASLRLSF